MPEIAEFVRSLRESFGDEVIDETVRGGKSGEPSFYACENGRSAGTAAPSGVAWRVTDAIRDRHFCSGCDGSRWPGNQLFRMAVRNEVGEAISESYNFWWPACVRGGVTFDCR
jgi:hypothetical protein